MHADEAGDATALPVRWIAPETLLTGDYSKASDVWSMGVLIWEVFAHGEMPYPSLNNEQVLQRIMQGYRMSRPEGCPSRVWDLAADCWTSPEQRPTFAALEFAVELCDSFGLSTAPSETELLVLDGASGTDGTDMQDALELPLFAVSRRASHDDPSASPYSVLRPHGSPAPDVLGGGGAWGEGAGATVA